MRARTTAPLLVVALAAAAGCGFDAPVLLDRVADAARDLDAGREPDAAVDAPRFERRPGTAIVAGQWHSCVLDAGHLSCWGQNDKGQLGVGDTTNRSKIVAVAPGRSFAEVCGGEAHGCGLEASTGAVLCWGDDANGQLGDPSLTVSLVPKAVPLGAGAIALGCGYQHTCAVLEDGSLQCWGANPESQLGRGTNSAREATPMPVAGGKTDWVRVAAGQAHTCAIRGDGSLWCWGRNSSGECAQPTAPPGDQQHVPIRVGTDVDWVRVVAAQDATCALRTDDSLWCWGDNAFGNLGYPPPASTTTPRRIGGPAAWSSLADETFHGAAIQRDGTLWTWGRNVEGQLGLGDFVDRTTPTVVAGPDRWLGVATGRFHTCALRTDRQVLCAGKNDTGALGTGDVTRRDVLTPTIR